MQWQKISSRSLKNRQRIAHRLSILQVMGNSLPDASYAIYTSGTLRDSRSEKRSGIHAFDLGWREQGF